jgi:parvulin-like peptidyl-prolyl isomerase
MLRRLRPAAMVALSSCFAFSAPVNQLFAADPVPAKAGAKEAEDPLAKYPKVVAIVGGQTITRERLAQECVKRFGPIVLDNFLNKHLIMQACQAKGIVITGEHVNQEISRMAGKYGLSPTLFLKAIEENRDFTADRYASEIVWPMLALRALAADKIQVSKEDVQKVFLSEYGAKVQVRLIAVSDKQKADELHAQIVAAPDQFRRLAKEHSEDAASASVEGLLPPIRQNSGDETLERIAFALKPDEVSPVCPISGMHIILQCVRHLPPNPPNPQYIPMIEERIADQLQETRLARAADELFKTLQDGSSVIQVVGNPELERQHPNVAGMINGQPIPLNQLAAECIARHGREILKGEINRVLLDSALKARSIEVTQADIDAEVARAADALGFIYPDGRPNIEAWIKSILEEEGATLELYIQDAVWPSVALKKMVADRVKVTEEDLQRGFESNYGPRAEVLAIVLSNQRIAEQVWTEARQNLNEANFGELAAKYSVEPVSRSNYGKVPPIRRYSGQPTLEKSAFDMNPGELSGVIAVGEQYVIMYKQGLSKPIVNDMQIVRNELLADITEKKLRIEMQNELDRLSASVQIDNFLEKSVSPGQVKAADTDLVVPLKNPPAGGVQPASASAAPTRQATQPTAQPRLR